MQGARSEASKKQAGVRGQKCGASGADLAMTKCRVYKHGRDGLPLHQRGGIAIAACRSGRSGRGNNDIQVDIQLTQDGLEDSV